MPHQTTKKILFATCLNVPKVLNVLKIPGLNLNDLIPPVLSGNSRQFRHLRGLKSNQEYDIFLIHHPLSPPLSSTVENRLTTRF
jgi:hypothetical protein